MSNEIFLSSCSLSFFMFAHHLKVSTFSDEFMIVNVLNGLWQFRTNADTPITHVGL